MDTAEARSARVVDRCVADIASRDNGPVGANAEGDTGKCGAARENVTTLLLRVLGTRNLAVVGSDDGGGEVEERGASVGDGVDAAARKGTRADGITVAGEFPEAVAGLDIDVGDRAGVFGCVDEAKVVGTRYTLLQVRREDWRRKAGLGIGEERLLRGRRYRVDAVKGKAEQAIVVCVLGELSADGFGGLDGLAGHGGFADGDDIGVDVATRAAAVTV